MDQITIAQQPRYQRALQHMAAHGPASYLDLEYKLGIFGMHRVVTYLQQHQMIVGLPKTSRGVPRKYEITQRGRRAIGLESIDPAQPKRIAVTERPMWTPNPALPSRPGAMQAYTIPSLAGRVPAHLAQGGAA